MTKNDTEHCFLGRQVTRASQAKAWFTDCVRFGLVLDTGGPPITVDFIIEAKDPSALRHAAHELEAIAAGLRALAETPA